MSYPKSVSKFIPWSKAMVEGATVDRPDYGKKMTRSKKSSQHAGTTRRRRRRKKKGRNASKD